MTFYTDIYDSILAQDVITKEDLHRLKITLCKKYKLKHIPSNSMLIEHIPDSFSEKIKEQLIQKLQRKPMRTISGVAIIAIMTSPELCPHGQCTPCPGGPVFDSPQSYTGFEPAAMRAKTHHYDPFNQVKARLYQLTCIGHPTDKIDLIIMGGTFTARNPWYQEWFIKRCYDALNESSSSSVEQAKQKNEYATHRCIGLTIETRPDWFRLHHIDQALNYGTTRVELGVQTIYDHILYTIKRGHTVSDSIAATRNGKNAGLKICYHFMPGLPGSTKSMDKKAFKTLFADPDFRPDMLKIYPCLVIQGTELYEEYKNHHYDPLTTAEATTLIAEMVKNIPKWVRIQRIQRDVPAQYISSGVKKSNLRQLVDDKVLHDGESLNDLRSRELGHMSIRQQKGIESIDPVLRRYNYNASESTEIFLSLNDKKHDAVIGYLRLRQITSSHRPELFNKEIMMIRELRVVGREIEIGLKNDKGMQHKGFGRILIQEAENISIEEYDCNDLFVLSGIGVKEYYRKYHDFKDDGIYLYKKLN